MSRRFLHAAAVICVLFFGCMAVMLSKDTPKEAGTPVYPVVAEATPEPQPTEAEAEAAAEAQPTEAVKEEATPTPTAIPTVVVVETGNDENSGCIGDDGLVW
ncbi:MAG: hypothetical protein IK115_14555 [Lachnospiraceae bacterium]|nr:hypothetical protein [Lachnospiraceae bacterium]